MASIYEVMTEMSSILTSGGYTVYDVTTFEDREVDRIPSEEFPVIFIGRGVEDVDNDAPTLHVLTLECPIDINVVINTGSAKLYEDSAIELRKIKNIMSEYRSHVTIPTTNCDYWTDWYMDDNYISRLNGSSKNDKVFGGININTVVNYREEENTNP